MQPDFLSLALPLQYDLYRSARALTQNEADALDLVQETYLRAWKAFRDYREDRKFRAWLFTILRHTHVDFCRRRKSQPLALDLDARSVPAPASFAVELSDDMQAALERLSPAHHLLLLLRETQGFSYKEISEIVGCPIGSVMSGLHHARAALRAELTRPVPK